MGRSFTEAGSAAMIEDWERNNHFYHGPSDQYYEMPRRGDQFWVRRYQLDRGGRQINVLERQITHIVGSGERARSYLHRTAEGRVVVLPVSWYPQEQRWAMAPGYDRPNHLGFSRTVNHKCMFCHNAYPKVISGADRQGCDDDVRFPGRLPNGIDCRRCHGPGGAHVRAAAAGEPPVRVRAAIVQPTRLPSERQLDLCMQCHLETTSSPLPESYRRFGRGFYSYLPGEPLGDYIVHFDHARGMGHDGKFEIVSSAYRLRQSACFLRSNGRMTCLTCHSPHQHPDPEGRAAYYRARCLACHSFENTKFHHPSSDCVACHMPARRTEDVVHVIMTDHLIQRGKTDRDLRAPLREQTDVELRYRGEVALYDAEAGLEAPLRDLYVGIAQVSHQSNLKGGVELLERAIAQVEPQHPEPYFELAQALLALGRRQEARGSYLKALAIDPSFIQAENNLGNLLADMGRLPEAIEHYRRARVLDPGSADVLSNLGLALLELGDQRGAEDAFLQAIAANSLYARARLNLGSLYLIQGKIEEALAHLESALAIEPSDSRAHSNLGLALLRLGRREQAVEHFERVLRFGTLAERESARQALLKARRPNR
jgi:tetratricopeptide (TPR) repeat protein